MPSLILGIRITPQVCASSEREVESAALFEESPLNRLSQQPQHRAERFRRPLRVDHHLAARKREAERRPQSDIGLPAGSVVLGMKEREARLEIECAPIYLPAAELNRPSLIAFAQKVSHLLTVTPGRPSATPWEAGAPREQNGAHPLVQDSPRVSSERTAPSTSTRESPEGEGGRKHLGKRGQRTMPGGRPCSMSC